MKQATDNRFHVLLRAMRYVVPDMRLYLPGVVLVAVQNFIMNWLTASMIRDFLDEILAGRSVSGVLIKFILLFGGYVICMMVGIALVEVSVAKAQVRVQGDLLKKHGRMPLEVINGMTGGKMLGSFIHGSDSVASVINEGLLNVLMLFISGFGCFGVILSLDWRLGLFAVASGFIQLLLYKKIARPLRKYSDLLYEAKNEVMQSYAEIVNGSETIRLFSLQDWVLSKSKASLLKQAKFAIKHASIQAQMLLCSSGQSAVSNLFVILFGSYLVAEGALTLPALMMAPALCGQITWAISDFGYVWGTMQSALSGAALAFDTLDLPEEAQNEGQPDVKILRGFPALDFENVSFQYKGEHAHAVSTLDLSLEVGTITALVGTSGAGKTTLFNLAAGLLQPLSGTIRLFGHTIAGVNLASWRHQFSYVQQNPMLISGTIAENLLLAQPDATDEALADAVQQVGLDQWISELPGGVGARVDEHGGNLSGGQKQRIAIGRAILSDAPILLLDEATSALDNAADLRLLALLQAHKQNHAILISAHRLSTIRNADAIVVMEDGKIVERGSHQELLALSGRYADLLSVHQDPQVPT